MAGRGQCQVGWTLGPGGRGGQPLLRTGARGGQEGWACVLGRGLVGVALCLGSPQRAPPPPGLSPSCTRGAASFKGGLIPAVLWGPGAVPKPSARQEQGQGSCPPGPGGTESSKAVRSWWEGHLSVGGSQSPGHGASWKPLPLPASPALGVHLLPIPLQAFTDLSSHPISKPQQDHQGPS